MGLEAEYPATMTRVRRLLVVAVCALPLSQLGHALASLLTNSGALEPGAAHAYFAADLTLSASVLAAAASSAGVVLVVARALRGGPLVRAQRSAWPLLWTFFALAALQLELYLVQELVEGSTTADVAWRGLIGQLPVAAAAALIIQWLSERLGPAARELRRHPFLVVTLAAAPQAERAVAVQLIAWAPRRALGSRGPPRLLRPTLG
jgi:hypothetical protein